jgi:hypothetical protein
MGRCRSPEPWTVHRREFGVRAAELPALRARAEPLPTFRLAATRDIAGDYRVAPNKVLDPFQGARIAYASGHQ